MKGPKFYIGQFFLSITLVIGIGVVIALYEFTWLSIIFMIVGIQVCGFIFGFQVKRWGEYLESVERLRGRS